MEKEHTTRNRKLFFFKVTTTLFILALALQTSAHEYHFKPIDSRFDAIARRMNDLDFSNERNLISQQDLTTLQHIANNSNNPQLKARAIYWQVRSQQMNARPRSCVALLQHAQNLCQPGYDYDRACIDYQLAGNYERMGYYLKAYNLLSTVLPIFKAHGDHYFMGNAQLLLAQLFSDINDPDNALEALGKAKMYYSRAGFPLNRIYFFEAVLASNNRKAFLYKQSIESGGDHDWGMTLQALNNLSQWFLTHNLTDSADIYNRQAFKLLAKQAPGNAMFESLCNIIRIRILYAKEQYGRALDLLQHEEGKDALKDERMATDIYEMLWRVYDRTGNQAAAYHYLQRYMKSYQANENEIKKQEIPKARAREAIAKRNDTIRLLEQDAELSRRFLYIMILVTAIVVVAAAALFVLLRQRIKISRIENKALSDNLQKEALIYSVNRQNFERDIKQKECEISSSTLLLANKNEVLQQISDITLRYSQEGRIPQEYVRQINAVIGDSLKNDDEWQRFKLHFDSVHPNFFIKLKEASSELTENDLRLCAYIRIGMRAKQIAEMLSVSPDSINSNRYRLRKKLGLQRGESLDDYIRKI